MSCVFTHSLMAMPRSSISMWWTRLLLGLCLHLEKGYSGREVQRAHVQLAKRRKQWPTFMLPEARGVVTVTDVLAAAPGPERDAAIERWCASVWEAWSASHAQVRELLQQELR